MDSKVKYPTPQGNAETKHFWEQAVEGKLLIKRCKACGEAVTGGRDVKREQLTSEWTPAA